MKYKQLKAANIENLTQLWKIMGATPHFIEGLGSYWVSDSWPNRCWFEAENFTETKKSTIADLINQAQEKHILPVWLQSGKYKTCFERLLINHGFEVVLEQTAMYLDLKKYPVQEATDLQLLTVRSEKDSETWTEIASRSFGYEIDLSVIRNRLVTSDVQLLMASHRAHPVATALLFKTGDIAGLHLFGVLAEYRGQGIARKFMFDIINLCQKIPAQHITLQASMAGKNLYESLGFKQQFMIKSYQRAIGTNVSGSSFGGKC